MADNKDDALSSRRDAVLVDMLVSMVHPYREKFEKEYGIKSSAPFLVGEDLVGMFFYKEGKLSLKWDSPIIELEQRIKEVPALIERQPDIPENKGRCAHEECKNYLDAFLRMLGVFR